MRDFFIWCSGASVEIVKKCDDKEISKYTNIGIVVFPGTALETILTPFTRSDLLHTIFICVKLLSHVTHI